MSNDGYDTPDNGNPSDNDGPPPEHYAAKNEQTDAENSLAMVLSVWWSFSWRFVALFVVTSFLIGLVLALATGGDVAAAERWGSVLSLIAAVPISIWSIGKALSTKHKQHRIIFVRS